MIAPMNSILTGSVIATFDENGNYHFPIGWLNQSEINHELCQNQQQE